MNELEIREELYNKIEKEFESYKEKLKQLPPDKVLDNAYQYVMKEELHSMFYPEYEKYDIEQVKALNKTEFPLQELYDGWMDTDVGINSILEDSVYDTLEEIKDIQIQKNKKNKAFER